MNYMPTGWLAPSGTLYNCDICDHFYLASKIVKIFDYSFNSTESNEDLLLKHGWVRITKSLTSGEYVIYWENFLTESQKNYLKPYFEDNTIKISKSCRLDFEEEVER